MKIASLFKTILTMLLFSAFVFHASSVLGQSSCIALPSSLQPYITDPITTDHIEIKNNYLIAELDEAQMVKYLLEFKDNLDKEGPGYFGKSFIDMETIANNDPAQKKALADNFTWAFRELKASSSFFDFKTRVRDRVIFCKTAVDLTFFILMDYQLQLMESNEQFSQKLKKENRQ